MTEIMLGSSGQENTGKPVFSAPKPPKKKKYRHLKAELKATFMASLPFIGFMIFTLFPMALSIAVSFSNLYSYNLDKMEFLGFAHLFDNYKTVLKHEDTWIALSNSLKYCLSVPINIGVSMLLAHLTSRKMVGTRVLRVLLFIPSICIGTAVAFIWQMIFADEIGVINSIVGRLGGESIGFMSTKELFMPSVITISLWVTGTNIIAMQAALSSVSPTLKEAARIDGAPEIQIFWKIIFPMITPTVFYLLIMNFVAAMQEQAMMQLLAAKINNGVGPDRSAITLSYQVYRLSFGSASMSYGLGVGCALSWLIAIMIMIVVKLLFWVSDKWVSYEND